MAEKTDMTVTWDKKVYDVPAGFTVVQYVDHLKAVFPEATTAELVKDGAGAYTLKKRPAFKG